MGHRQTWLAVAAICCFCFSVSAKADALRDCVGNNYALSTQQIINACRMVISRGLDGLSAPTVKGKAFTYALVMATAGNALMNTNQFPGAIKQYSELLDFLQAGGYDFANHLYYTGYHSVYLRRGLAYLRTYQYDKALEDAGLNDKYYCAQLINKYRCPGPSDWANDFADGVAGSFSSAEFRGDVAMDKKEYQLAKLYYETKVKTLKRYLDGAREFSAMHVNAPDLKKSDDAKAASLEKEISGLQYKLAQANNMISQPAGTPLPKVNPTSEACQLFPNLC